MLLVFSTAVQAKGQWGGPGSLWQSIYHCACVSLRPCALGYIRFTYLCSLHTPLYNVLYNLLHCIIYSLSSLHFPTCLAGWYCLETWRTLKWVLDLCWVFSCGTMVCTILINKEKVKTTKNNFHSFKEENSKQINQKYNCPMHTHSRASPRERQYSILLCVWPLARETVTDYGLPMYPVFTNVLSSFCVKYVHPISF